MSSLSKQFVIWMMLLAISVQGLAAVTSVLQGPAHSHTTSHAPSTMPVKDAQASHHPYYAHTHEGEVRRHYHLPGEGAVLVQDHPHDDFAAAGERNSKSESAGSAFVALIHGSPAFHTPDLLYPVSVGSAKKLLSCLARRIERPPRLLLA